MILAEAAEQTSSFATQAFLYVAIAIAVGYFGWQFYKGAKEDGPLNTGWLSGSKKKDDASADEVGEAAALESEPADAASDAADEPASEAGTESDDSSR